MDRLLHNLPPTDAIKDEPFRRIEVITGVERRRRWSEEDKARIVAESLEPGVVVADVARRYGIHRNQLYGWRSAFGVQPAKTGHARRRASFQSRSCRRCRKPRFPAGLSRSPSGLFQSDSPVPSMPRPCARFSK